MLIAGANGSGKSTLARHLNGLLLPTSGEVRIMGRPTHDPEDIMEIRYAVGYVFQNPENQIVAGVVQDDVAFGPENLGLDPSETRIRVEESLRAVHLWNLRERSVFALSGGEKQRLALAGVLAMRPRCIVLDEPCSLLDGAARKGILDLLAQFNREHGTAIIYFTHDLAEIGAARRVVLLAGGCLVADGRPADLLPEAHLLKSFGLEAPPLAVVGELLRSAGVLVPRRALSVKEMVEALCGSG